MTEDEIAMRVHVAIMVNLEKLPQLKGKGKANAEQREIHLKVFIEAVTEHFQEKRLDDAYRERLRSLNWQRTQCPKKRKPDAGWRGLRTGLPSLNGVGQRERN
jgi:hypothetical protein